MELYCDYSFDTEVRFFTDFMQSQMSQKMNQLFVPGQNIAENDFLFYNKGKELWSMSNQFKDDIEDKIRNQLEISDALQGFQLTVDVNSGFGSMANQIITVYLKDEMPKAPVYLYAVNNDNKLLIDETASEEERVNLKMRQGLMELN